MKPFSCFENVVGMGNSNMSPEMREIHEWDWPFISSGYDRGQRFDYRLNPYLAFNADSSLVGAQQATKPLSVQLDPRLGLSFSNLLNHICFKFTMKTIR
jgi:hypothetical protein